MRVIVLFHGALGRTRTDTPLKETDFESVASTNSATRARLGVLYRSDSLASTICLRQERAPLPPSLSLSLTCLRLYSSAMLRALYDAVLRLSAHRRAGWVLGAVSFIESSVFPLPPDLLLVPMIFSERARAWTLAAITTITSALGALLGYAIGALFWDTLGSQIVFLYGGQEAFDSFQAFYVEWGLLVLLAAAVTFLPFKIATIASGVAGLPLVGFFITSLVGRGLRFYLVAAGAYYLGPGMRRQFERNFARMSAVTGILALLLFIYLFMRH